MSTPEHEKDAPVCNHWIQHDIPPRVILLGIFFTIFCPCVLGYLTFSRISPFASGVGRVGFSATLGLIIFTWVGFFLSTQFLVSWTTIFLSLFLQAAFAGFIVVKHPLRFPSHIFPKSPVTWGIIFLAGFYSLAMLRMVFIKNDGLWTHHWLGGSDFSTHLVLSSSFIFADNLPPLNPYYANTPLLYPFLADFLSGIVWFASKDMQVGMALPSAVMIFFLVLILFAWGQGLQFRKKPPVAPWAFLVPVLFLANGSLGILFQPGDFSTQITQKNILFVNHLQTLINQKSLLFGVPLVVITLVLWSQGLQLKQKKDLYLAAFVAGLLPMVHGHSIVALALFLFFLTLFSKNRRLSLFPTIVIGILWLPQVLYLSGRGFALHNQEPLLQKSFLTFNPGWMCNENLLWFWFKNTSLWIPLGLLATTHAVREKNPIMPLALGAWTLFILANLFNFAPWPWDNTKIFFYWFLCLTPAIVFYFSYLWQKSVVVVFFLFISLTLSGLADTGRFFLKSPDLHFFGPEDLAISDWAKAHTEKDAVFVSNPKRNHPLILAGRSVLLGSINIETWGLPAKDRYLASLLIGGGKPESLSLIKHYGIDYILYGPEEKDLGFDPNFLASIGEVVFTTKNVQVFKIKPATF